jgi:hypothetical protein
MNKSCNLAETRDRPLWRYRLLRRNVLRGSRNFYTNDVGEGSVARVKHGFDGREVVLRVDAERFHVL